MQANRQNETPYGKKAFELSYALFRIAAHSDSLPFREYLEKQALRLLEHCSEEQVSQAKNCLVFIDYLAKMGQETGSISYRNAAILQSEINELSHLLSESGKGGKVEDVSLEGIFSHNPAKRESGKSKSESLGGTSAELPDKGSEFRQNIILDKIRQSGNCRVKDLQEILPSTSERTVRYDLQELVKKGLIERGGTGPAVFYHLAGSPPPPAIAPPLTHQEIGPEP